MSFDNIPDELKSLHQWVVWKYVKRPDGKWTKLPYNARTLMVASATGESTWSDFFTACTTAQNVEGVAGVGFVLTPEDDYCFTDLDDPYALNPDGSPKFPNPDEIMAQQRQVLGAMQTYAEYSPSGKGLHIISKGFTPVGKRKGAIELYSSERYMTMTGNVFQNLPITNQQPAIDWLYQMLGGTKEQAQPQIGITYEPDKDTDENIIAKAINAANGVKVQALWEGRFQDAGYSSQSEADWALIDQLQFYTMSRQQIRRLFMQSGLGQRDKAKRPGYVESMIDRSFDRIPASVDLDALAATVQREQEEITARREQERLNASTVPTPALPPPDEPEVDTAYNPDDPSPYLRPVPGLLGAIAWFIYQAAPRPVPEIAMAGAIGLLAGIAGRAFNVNSTGLNTYVLLLAKTGRGKEAIATGIGRLMTPVRQNEGGGGVPAADTFLGPQEIASGQALIKYMAKTSQSFVSIMSEFDGFLSGLTARNAPQPVVKLKHVLMYAYGRSGRGQQLDKAIYSEAEKNVPVVPSPAISLIGEGTPDRFYELLSDGLVADGFLPRFSVIEYDGPRVKLNPSFAFAQPEPGLVAAVAKLCGYCLVLNQKQTPVDVTFTPEAKALLDAFDMECDRKINNRESSSTLTELWNRAHLKALKLAALIAVGVNFYNPQIEAQHAQWAIDCSRYDTQRLANRFDTGTIGFASADMRQIDDVKKKLKRLFDGKTVDGSKYKLPREATNAGIFNNFYLQNSVSQLLSFKEDKRGASVAYHSLMQSLVRMGVIDELNRADRDKFGILGSGYIVKSYEWLNS